MKICYSRNSGYWTKRSGKLLRRKLGFKRHRLGRYQGNQYLAKIKHSRIKFADHEKVFAPKDLSLARNYEKTASFLKEVADGHQALNETKGKRLISLKHIEEISPEAALVLAAHLDRIKQLSGNRVMRPIEAKSWSKEVKYYLLDMGFAELMQFDRRFLGQHRPDRDLTIIPFKHNTGFAKSVDAADFKERVKKVAGGLEAALLQRLYECFFEVVNNAVEHGYSLPLDPGYHIPCAWWISGAYNQRTKELHICAYDQGVGIPETISRKIDFFSTDAALILRAVEYGKTGTKKHGRGNGMPFMATMVDLTGSGSLTIFSGSGQATYTQGKWSSQENREKLEGTLIYWKVSLAKIIPIMDTK